MRGGGGVMDLVGCVSKAPSALPVGGLGCGLAVAIVLGLLGCCGRTCPTPLPAPTGGDFFTAAVLLDPRPAPFPVGLERG